MISEERIMGFVEGEGCFSIAIQRCIDRTPRKGKRRNKIRRPYLFAVRPTFRLTISNQDRLILEEIRETLGFGQIYTQNRSIKDPRYKDVAYYYTEGLKDCVRTKDFFKSQKFYTQKGYDFELWCKVLELIEAGKHLEKEGILQICRIRDEMNKRASKGKWAAEVVEKILEARPIRNPAHLTEKQAKLLHNKNIDLQDWLKYKPGNNMKRKSESNIAEKPVKAQETANATQELAGK